MPRITLPVSCLSLATMHHSCCHPQATSVRDLQLLVYEAFKLIVHEASRNHAPLVLPPPSIPLAPPTHHPPPRQPYTHCLINSTINY